MEMSMTEVTDLVASTVAAAMGKGLPTPWEIGQNYLIRTVTMIDTGRLVAVTENELVLEDAAWIADTGRFSETLVDGKFNEVEPFPDGARVIIGRGSVIDAVKIASLPRTKK